LRHKYRYSNNGCRLESWGTDPSIRICMCTCVNVCTCASVFGGRTRVSAGCPPQRKFEGPLIYTHWIMSNQTSVLRPNSNNNHYIYYHCPALDNMFYLLSIKEFHSSSCNVSFVRYIFPVLIKISEFSDLFQSPFYFRLLHFILFVFWVLLCIRSWLHHFCSVKLCLSEIPHSIQESFLYFVLMQRIWKEM
jgi:hypothetical protein